MNPFILLVLAIASEVVGTTALKQSAGFTRLWPSLLVVAGYATSFYLLSLTLKQIPIGVTYAIWSGLGTVGIVLVGALLLRESVSPAAMLGIGLIVAGVTVLNVFGGAAH
ncbi:MAG TPA: multidrug efflux SMR transporter [Kouleothrix sp.]|uniref:DMT family transporter n=1 Tax=Kouleothrix sp. TaxID=2779161 RepID=UPI002CAC458B|nr:multidrug efflux SMR transporter [Kouleothrix sp.]HRC76297.1 multidrug efflux SMR transporter [Kouleothrix sp.]